MTSRIVNLKKAGSLLLLAAALGLWGCEESKPTAPSQPKPSEFETGRFALQKMLAPARLWSQDALPINLRSQVFKDSNGQDGKSGFWRAVFASPARQKAEPFSWSGMASEDTPRGVNHGVEDTFNPNNRSTQPFDLNFLKVDTDKALEVAQQHGGKALLEKDPKQPIMYMLDFDAISSQLRWHVIYGDSESTAKLTVLVDASTGQFLRKE